MAIILSLAIIGAIYKKPLSLAIIFNMLKPRMING
jgi:hypothetical protein